MQCLAHLEYKKMSQTLILQFFVTQSSHCEPTVLDVIYKIEKPFGKSLHFITHTEAASDR